MSFLKHSVQTVIVRVLLLGVTLLGGVINARWLGPEGVGIVALLMLVQALAFSFGNLGYGTALAFFMGRNKAPVRTLLRLLWAISAVMSILTGFLLLLVWQWKISPWNDVPPLLFYMTLPTALTIFPISYLQRILSGQLRITVVNLSHVLSIVSFVALVIIFVVVLEMGVQGAVLAFVSSQLLMLAFLVVQVLSSVDQPGAVGGSTPDARVKVRDLWEYGRWAYLNLLLMFLLHDLPIFFLKYFGSNQLVGIFSVGRGLLMRTDLVFKPFASVLFPYTASSQEGEAVKRTNTLCRNATLAMLLLMILLGPIAEPLIQFLYGEAFLPAVPIFYILMPGILLFPLIRFLTVHIAASGDPRLTSLSSGSGVLTAVLMCALLVPRYGAIGAALAASGVYMVMTGVLLVVYRRYTGAKIRDVLVVKPSNLALLKSAFNWLASRITERRGA